MSKEAILVKSLAQVGISLGMSPPRYPKPKWYQFSLKKRLRYYDKMGWPYTLEGNNED